MIKAKEFLDLSQGVPVIDVRSPGEFETGHIPNAFNIPIFNNAERADVGTLYKQKGKDQAMLRGLEIVGPKMASFVREAKNIAKKQNLLIHCWRGGMRSSSMAWLLRTAGLECQVLDGGYKAYRKYIRDAFNKNYPILILSGYTGCGKTAILNSIGKQQQVIDLEGIANHRGSAFGSVGKGKQPTNEQFENNLYTYWEKLNPQQPVWLEDESQSIGRTWLPANLYKKMTEAVVIKIEIPRELRIKRLVMEYGSLVPKHLDDMKVSVQKISKRLGGLATKNSLQALEQGNLAEVADICLHYYDKTYHFSLQKKTGKVYSLTLKETEPEMQAKEIIEFAKKKGLTH